MVFLSGSTLASTVHIQSFFFFNDTATTEIYTLSLHDALPISMPAAASANPRAMPRPMPPLPPVTIATLPPRSNSSVFIVRFPLAFALPDQDQTESCKRRAVTGPLDLVDHKARWRPGDRAGALTDPEQTYGERKKAEGQKQFAHGLFSRALVQLSWNGDQSDALAYLGQEQGRRL